MTVPYIPDSRYYDNARSEYDRLRSELPSSYADPIAASKEHKAVEGVKRAKPVDLKGKFR